MASIQERKTQNGSKSYRVLIRIKGHPSISATFQKKTDAKRWADKIEYKIRIGKYFPEDLQQGHSFFEAIDKYVMEVLSKKTRNRKNIFQHLSWWKKEVGDLPLNMITTQLLSQKRDILLSQTISGDRKRSSATAVRYLSSLSNLFNVALDEWNWVKESPVRKVKRPKESKGRVRYLSEEELQNLLIHAKNHKQPLLYPLIVLSISTGMRQSEALYLKWRDVDLEKKLIHLKNTKNGERRTIPITGTSLVLLKEILNMSAGKTVYVFQEPGKQAPFTLRRMWENLLRESNIHDFKWHDLRHCTGSYLAMNGASILEIAEILGHKSLKMTKRYTHLSTNHTEKVLSKMTDKIFPI